ncbi:AAA family ATPase [Kineococcus sp. SYSU DK006]|uniref:AAA family ATPase n=1 Tax=Kineococcus sp. SYSU DK006 TaxID=3383127 RepID=UPI003D7E5D7F
MALPGGDDGRAHGPRPVAVLLVGLPAAGKTVRARQLERELPALRFTPDEWMLPLFGVLDAMERRDVLEGRLLTTALAAVRLGTSVVVDFGLWSRDERWALRRLFTDAGARCRLVHLDVDPATQRARVDARRAAAPHEEVEMSDAALRGYREAFQDPGPDELSGDEVPDPPAGHRTWAAWAAQRWPSLRPDPPG